MAYRGTLIAAAVAASAILAVPGSAEAKCARLGFSVNDYGKEGPTKDAQALLDKHIVDWTAKRGITKYSVGKKDVTCELFLDFGVFDEHTCKAQATVCWGDGGAAAAAPATPTAPAAAQPAAVAPVKKAAPSPAKAPAPAKAPVPATAPAKKKADQPA